MDAAREAAVGVDQADAVAGDEVQRGSVLGMHEHGVARRAGERIGRGVYETIELLAAPRAEDEAPKWAIEGGQRHRMQVRLAVRGGEQSVGGEMPTAVLKGVSGPREMLDAVVERDDASDLGADGRTALAAELRGAQWVDGGRQLAKDPPLRLGFADLARQLRAEHHPPLRAGLRAATVLLVARLGRQQDHCVAGLDQHLVGEDDVLVHA
jgi:hypothetical protein